MSLIRRKKKEVHPETGEELIKLSEAARILALDESTIRKGRAGTTGLALIRRGAGPRARIYLLRSEVLAHKRREIDEARRLKDLPDSVVWKRQAQEQRADETLESHLGAVH